MAQQVQIVLVSDLQGGPADETVRFGLDGRNYEIDLSTDEAAALRSALNRCMKAGRKIAGSVSRRGKSRSVAAAAPGRDENRKIRDWAKGKGLPCVRAGTDISRGR